MSENNKTVTISIPPKLHDKAKKISKTLFGKENVSGLYSYWLQCYNVAISENQKES